MQAPQASFSVFPAVPSINDVVELDAAGSTGQGLRYEWDFDSNGIIDQTTNDAVVRHFFDQSGDAEVTLHITDNSGSRATRVQTVNVSDSPVRVRRTFESSFEPNQVPAGGSLFVLVTVEVHADASGLGLAEQLPDGWRARPIDDGGAIFKRSIDELQWLWATSMLAGDVVTVRYELIVPSGISHGNYNLSGEVSSFLPNRFKLPVHSLLGIEVL